jgi:SAM-dependent methyltransferase
MTSICPSGSGGPVKKLLINPDAFIIHHAFKTGTRVRGDQNTPGGWNSKEMIDRTNQFLIKKHGFKAFMESMRGLSYVPSEAPRDLEGETVSQMVQGEKVYELGCGFRKTVPHAIGIDITPKGELCDHLYGNSVADIVADVTKRLPLPDLSADTVIARHILEHCLNPISTLRHWNRVVKIGGNLVIAVPDHSRRNTIPLNPEHSHGYTPESLKDLLELCGFKQTAFF